MAQTPECLQSPEGSDSTLSASAETLHTKAGTIGDTLTSFTDTSSGAMDAIDGPRAQQLYYYYGKGKSLLTNAEDAALASGDAIDAYAIELSDVKEVLETNRDRWLELELEKGGLTGGVCTPDMTDEEFEQAQADATRLSEINGEQAICEQNGIDQQNRIVTARSQASESLAAVYLELDPLSVSMEGKAYEAELFEIRDGMTLQDLGYTTPEQQAAWFTEEGAGLKEHELEYSEVAKSGYGTMSEADMLAAGLISEEQLNDGIYTPGAIPGYYEEEAWQSIVEGYLGEERVGELDAMFPGLFSSTGSPLTTPYAPTPAQPEDVMTPPQPGDPDFIGPVAPESGAAHTEFDPRSLKDTSALAGSMRHVWRFYLDPDGRAYRLNRYVSDLWMNYQDYGPNAMLNGGRMPRVPYEDVAGLHGADRTRFHNPFQGENAYQLNGDGKSPLYHGFVDGKRGVPKVDGRNAHLAHLQEGVGQTSAFKPEKWGNWVSGMDLGVARALNVAGIAGDAYTLINGSPYEGARGEIDMTMAGIGLAAGAAGLASTAGLVTLGAVAAPVTIAAGVVTGAWAIGNLVYDNAENWNEGLDNAGEAADQWLSDNLGPVGEGLGWAVDGTLDGLGDGMVGFKNGVDGVVDVAGDVGDAISDGWNSLWN